MHSRSQLDKRPPIQTQKFATSVQQVTHQPDMVDQVEHHGRCSASVATLQSGQKWNDFIEQLEAECEFRLPASPAEIKQVETALSVQLPDSLRELLLETNGVYSRPMYNSIVWHTDEIIQRNTLMRQDSRLKETHMAFESLLFFADGGVDGIMFAFPISARVAPGCAPVSHERRPRDVGHSGLTKFTVNQHPRRI